MRRLVGPLVSAVVALSAVTAWAQGLPPARPVEVGLSAERLDRIGSALRGEIEKGKFPGAIALIARKGRVAYFESFGFRDKATGAPMSKDAIFRIYSMTKPLVSVGALVLMEEGRLVLTDPEDLLATGIEVEVRPAGKRVSRLSLLSGGERSLTAVALLVAIFRARPSPFYVLDEVEAALDDLNIDRFLALVRGYASRSQFIVITHQRRTMEAAHVLYGVSMGRDGVSKVVSRRLEQEQDSDDGGEQLSAVA